MPVISTADGTGISSKDRGEGQPVVFSHGRPLCADAWDRQLFALASNGFRAVAHDRRGHGRSDQPWHGNDMDTYADDLAAPKTAELLEDAELTVYPGQPHGLTGAHEQEFTDDLLAFARG